jgi:hypothetical protein
MSLSQSALALLNEMGYSWSQVRGPAYWEFEGETLNAQRERIEHG